MNRAEPIFLDRLWTPKNLKLLWMVALVLHVLMLICIALVYIVAAAVFGEVGLLLVGLVCLLILAFFSVCNLVSLRLAVLAFLAAVEVKESITR